MTHGSQILEVDTALHRRNIAEVMWRMTISGGGRAGEVHLEILEVIKEGEAECFEGEWSPPSKSSSGSGVTLTAGITRAAMDANAKQRHTPTTTATATGSRYATYVSEVVLKGCVIFFTCPDAATCAFHATFQNDF